MKKDAPYPEQRSERLIQTTTKQPRPQTGVDVVVKKDLKKKIQKMINQSSAAVVNISLFDGACQHSSIDAGKQLERNKRGAFVSVFEHPIL